MSCYVNLYYLTGTRQVATMVITTARGKCCINSVADMFSFTKYKFKPWITRQSSFAVHCYGEGHLFWLAYFQVY